MKMHIHIPHIVDFYILFSKKDPDKRNALIVESINVSKDSFDADDLKTNLDRINMWIGNCDQKASFVLAVIGVVMTILLTSDFVKYLRKVLIEPFKQVWPLICDTWNIWQWLIAIVTIGTAVLGILSIYNLLFTLRAKTDLSKFMQAGIQGKSMFHFETVAKRSYKEYCEDKVDFLNDIRTQVYVNSCICTSKFKHYTRGIQLLEWTIVGCVLLGLLILLY